ncbi:MAG: hypothetical protein N2999_06895 [Proteobacteria bacterium]|nr:hypothetical protein [Pseudomonadota bacterium]
MKNILLISIILITMEAYAQPVMQKRPYGAYCPDGRRGVYGERFEVKDINSAREILKKFYQKNDDIRIGEISERRGFFEANIYGKDGNIIDILIIHKKTGRIRSIY